MKRTADSHLAHLAGIVLATGLAACGDRATTARACVHLTEVLARAKVATAPSPAKARAARRWSFADEQPDWRVFSGEDHEFPGRAAGERRGDAMRLRIEGSASFRGGGLAVALDGLSFSHWETVVVTARTSDRFAGVALVYNHEEQGAFPPVMRFFDSPGEVPPMFSDGSTQSYAMPLRPRGSDEPESLNSLAILFGAPGPAEVDVLAVELVPRGAAFVEDAGTRSVERGGTTRHSLYSHAPARLTFEIGEGAARLDFGLTVERGDEVTYRVLAGEELLLEQTVEDATAWRQCSVELPGGSAALVLEAESLREGAVALWGAPVLSRGAAPERPNVVFYVIDGGDADLMSLYEYGRPTTPYLEELAREGVLFTRAHSNATWTQPSTLSFLTSLQHSVLGGLRRGIHSTSLPENAQTMAEHFRRAGYQTACFTANPNAGRIIGTERGVDFMRDVSTAHHSTSSVELHDRFFDWREDYPGAPFFVHFQTTDVHEPNEPHGEFEGRFVSEDEREQLGAWDQEIWNVAWEDFGTTSVQAFYDAALERAGIDRKAYFDTRRGLYDETMLHQDWALKELVEDLKERGAWEDTIFVLGSDHGHPAGTFARFGRGALDPQPEPWEGAMCDAYATRVPLLVIWPGHIEGDRRIDDPVSMIDVLPTLLDLLDLPAPDLMMGQSLGPLLRGDDQERGPVILDEFRVDETSGEMVGNLEVIDGRWGASLEIGPLDAGADPTLGRHAVPAGGRWGAVHPYFDVVPRLLLYDLEQDPFATRSVHAEHPELVERYRALLLKQWQAHQALGLRFWGAEDATLSPEQLEQLRALGYVR